MIVPCTVRKRVWVVLFAAGLLGGSPLPAPGQETRPQPDEVKAVVRISRQLIDDVVGRKEIVAAIPYHAKVLGFSCKGVIDGVGKLTMDMSAVEGEGVFLINGRGTAQTSVRGVRGPIVATGHAWGPFATRTPVRFDGRKFYQAETVPWCEVAGTLDCVEGRRGGPAGRAAGRLLLPLGEHLVPRAEREATPIANHYLTNFVRETGEDIVARLNRTAPVEQSLNRLFPQTKHWVFQLSTGPRFIQAAYGPRAVAVPALPENPARTKDSRLELWLKSSTTEAQALETLSKKPLARPLVQRYLDATLPELAALSEQRTVAAAGEWLVITIDEPKAK